MLGGWRR